MTRPFISSRETLLTFGKVGGRPFIEETNFFGETIESASVVAADLYGNEIKFLRLDLETNTGEDVTEDIAKAWLDENRDYDRDDCPEFVGDYLDSLPQSFTEDADSAADRANDLVRDLEAAE